MAFVRYDDREFFDALIKLYHEHYKGHLIHCLEAGAKVIFGSWYNCSMSAGWSPTIYRECFLPCIKEDIAITHSYGAYFHIYDDGKFMPIAKDLFDTGMDVISTLCPPPAGDADPVRLKELAKDKVVLNGYVDLVKIRWGTPEEVAAETKYAIETMGPGGGYMLGTSDSIRDGSPDENVAAFFKTGLEYGKY